MIKYSLVLFPVLIIGNSYAGSFNSKIEYVQINVSTTSASIKFEVDPTNPPACASDPRMSVDVSTDAGRAVYSMALSAHATGRVVFGKGVGVCDVTSTMDSIRYIRQL